MHILKILFKNAFRHRLRTGLTIISIMIALLAFGLLRTVIDAWYAGVEASSAYRLVTRNAVSIIFPLPLSYKDRIRQVDGVSRFHGATGSVAFISMKRTFSPILPLMHGRILTFTVNTSFRMIKKRHLCGIERDLSRDKNWPGDSDGR